jgi:hypothetical protein
MHSILWNFIESRSNRFLRLFVWLLLILGGVLFSLPRLGEAWFVYALIAYPILTFGLLGLTKSLLRFLPKIRENTLAIVQDESDQQELYAWWESLGKKQHVLLSLLVAILLAGLSLVFNANPAWSRYTDALGISYIGFIAGEIVYLLLLVPSGIFQLKKYELRLNPVLPGQTVDLRILAESCFALAVGIGFSLLALNVVVAMASYLFHHLLFGIILISVLSWMAIIGLSVYPHLILFDLVQQEKRKTLEFLESQISEQYERLVNAKKMSSSLDELLKVHTQVLESKSFPISNSALFSIITTLVLNLLPVILGIFMK